MNHVRAWVAAFVALWWGWILLAGEWNAYQWIAATAAAAVAATLGEVARSSARVRARVPVAWFRRAWTSPLMVFADFGVLMLVLGRAAIRREIPEGTFRSKRFTETATTPRGFGIRAWVEYTATLSPNAYVVDIDLAEQTVLLHDLVPWRRSEEPA